MISDKFILDDAGNPTPCDDLLAWADWIEFNRNKRRVASTSIGEAKVSTVFLGLDHGFGSSEPILWETMVFGGEMDEECERCGGNRVDAENMHSAMTKRVQQAENRK